MHVPMLATCGSFLLALLLATLSAKPCRLPKTLNPKPSSGFLSQFGAQVDPDPREDLESRSPNLGPYTTKGLYRNPPH